MRTLIRGSRHWVIPDFADVLTVLEHMRRVSITQCFIDAKICIH